MKAASHFGQPVDTSCRVVCGSVLFKSKGLQPFVPGFEARTRECDVRISILMVNHSLLKSKCGSPMAISRQKYRMKFMVNGTL
jgi:hypothetical protein